MNFFNNNGQDGEPLSSGGNGPEENKFNSLDRMELEMAYKQSLDATKKIKLIEQFLGIELKEFEEKYIKIKK